MRSRKSLRFLSVLVVAVIPAGALQAAEIPSGFEGALQAVVRHHPAIRGKVDGLRSAESSVDGFKARRYPTLSAKGSYEDDGNDLRETLTLRQPLYAFGKINTPISRAEAEFAAEKADLLRIVRELIGEAGLAYSRIEGIRSRQEIASQYVKDLRTLYEQIERRYKGKLASESDTQLALSRYHQARSDVDRYQGELRNALSALRALTFVEVETDDAVSLTGLVPPQKPVEVVLKSSALLSLKRRQLEVAQLGIKENRTNAYPTVSLNVEHDLRDRVGIPDETIIAITFEAGLDGMGLVNRSRVDGAKSRADAAWEDFLSSQNDVKEEVAVLTNDLAVRDSLLKTQIAVVEVLEATNDSYQRRYLAGHQSWLDLLNIQRELTQQRRVLSDIENESLGLRIRLANLCGQLDELAGMKNVDNLLHDWD